MAKRRRRSSSLFVASWRTAIACRVFRLVDCDSGFGGLCVDFLQDFVREECRTAPTLVFGLMDSLTVNPIDGCADGLYRSNSSGDSAKLPAVPREVSAVPSIAYSRRHSLSFCASARILYMQPPMPHFSLRCIF